MLEPDQEELEAPPTVWDVWALLGWSGARPPTGTIQGMALDTGGKGHVGKSRASLAPALRAT
jgi:hypothetical protein